MKAPEFYRGREQTYIKHFFLEKYLERVAFNILSGSDEFVYVDGFAGPWQAADESLEDTSFVIAINQLRKVRDALRDRSGKSVRIRCLFSDSNPVAFESLQRAVGNVSDIEVHAVCSNFEQLVPAVVNYAGSAFCLLFIDPTGWTGFGLAALKPALRLRGEVIINLMSDFLNRFIDHPSAEVAASLDLLFGDDDWLSDVNAIVASGATREQAVLTTYLARLRNAGGYKHVTSTRVLKPLSDRSYFHLVYGTRHWKGVKEFRSVEERVVDEQERVRDAAKMDFRVASTGQSELLLGPSESGSLNFRTERQRNLDDARQRLRSVLSSRRRILYEDLLGEVLEIPLVWERDIKEALRAMRAEGTIEIPALVGRATTPKPGQEISWTGTSTDRSPPWM